MYGRGAASTVIGGSITTGSGIAMLPYTAGNPVGTILAYSAIGIGIAVLVSHLVVRLMRRIYQ
jgi:hypothetical protein